MHPVLHRMCLRYLIVCLIIATLVNFVGFVSPYWSSGILINAGLWQFCDFEGYCKQFDITILDDKFETVRAFEGIGFICTLVALLFSILYSCVSKTSGNKIVGLIGALACFGAAGCILIGVIIYSSENSNLDWAFGLSTAGGVLFGLAGIIHICAMCKT